MKTIKFTILFLLFTTLSFSQDFISLSAFHDVRFATVGDDKGNTPLTLNAGARLSLEGYQVGQSYSSIIAEFEGADLEGGEYYRWSAGYAQNFNEILENFTFSPSLQIAVITRPDATITGMGNLDIAYNVTDHFSILLVNQWIKRTDLETSPIRYSLFAGVKLNLFTQDVRTRQLAFCL